MDHGPEVQTGHAGPQHAFGYFLSPTDTPFEPAPAPPPGPSLLDDNESNMLDNFFTTLNSNHLDTTDFWLRGQQNKSVGTFNFEWSDELPPTFKGSTTSLSQHSLPHHSLDVKNGVGFLSSDDIFAAASMIYSNGTHEGLGSTLGHQQFHDHALSGINGNNSASSNHTKNLQRGSHSTSKEPRSRVPVAFHTSEMFFDVHQPVPADQEPRKVRTLQWGSDIGFMNQGYIPPPNHENETSELLHYMECLEPQHSVPNTRAPSPERSSGPHRQWAASNDSAQSQNGLQAGNEGTRDEDSKPKKRQKTAVKHEPGEDSDTVSPRPRRKSKSSNNIKTRRASNDVSSRKPRQQNGTKPARENLTEEQKRTNHILSEQKRRNLIRQGFDELCSLVPGLRGGGFSKSAMLTQAADWLEDVLRGNEILRAQLAELKAMNGLVMPR